MCVIFWVTHNVLPEAIEIIAKLKGINCLGTFKGNVKTVLAMIGSNYLSSDAYVQSQIIN